jgi:hypothetical protein
MFVTTLQGSYKYQISRHTLFAILHRTKLFYFIPLAKDLPVINQSASANSLDLQQLAAYTACQK